MILGLGTYALAWSIGVPGYTLINPWKLDDVIAYAIRKKLNCIQIADNLPLHTLSEKELEKLNHDALTHNLRLEAGTRGLQPHNLEQYFKIASRINSPILRVVIDSADYSPSVDEIIRTIKLYVPELEERNVKLAIENHDRLKASTFVHIIESVGSPMVGICLDTVNSFGQAEGLETAIEQLIPYTINLHIKDFQIRRHDHNMGFSITGTPAGEGRLPLPELINRLRVLGKCESAILELWPEPETTANETAEKEQEWVHKSLDYLKKIFEAS